MKKTFIILALACGFATASADTVVDILSVQTQQSDKSFAIENVAQVTFSDTEMMVTITDGATFSFPNSNGWSITFGQGEPEAGISAVYINNDASSPASIYDTNGRLIGNSSRLDQLETKNLPTGLYIIKCNGKSFKIQR